MTDLNIGPAESCPFALSFIGAPSVLPIHTPTAIDGLYPITQPSPGATEAPPASFLFSLVDVPVFAATVCPATDRLPPIFIDSSERMSLIKNATCGSRTSLNSVVSCSSFVSIMSPLAFSILTIVVSSGFRPSFPKVE